jgi:hypothetical protein
MGFEETMEESSSQTSPKHILYAFIRISACGCATAMCVDFHDQNTLQTVLEYAREGSVRRVPIEEARKVVGPCRCDDPYNATVKD